MPVILPNVGRSDHNAVAITRRNRMPDHGKDVTVVVRSQESGVEQPNTAGPISDQHRLDADGPAPLLHMSANSTSWQFLSSQTKSQLEKATK